MTGAGDDPVSHDRLISTINWFNREDEQRAETAAETREAITAFLDDTKINKKAFAFARSILKQSDEQKALDIIRSMELILPMIANHVRGQTPEMSFDDAPDAVSDEDDEEVVPFGDEAD